MLRRDFLKVAGTFLAGASLPGTLSSCFHNEDGSNGSGYRFPQGVASGDPRPTSVVIWTRVEPHSHSNAPAHVTAEVALDEKFNSLVLQELFEVSSESDYTLRVIVEGLQPDTFYFYRFLIDTDTTSTTGRTLTAPAISDQKEISFAFVSCQDRSHGFYSAYRRMLTDDIAAPTVEQLRFVLHLGDFIYETIDDPLQAPVDEALNAITDGLVDRQGQLRAISPFPSGAVTSRGVHYANTLDDYRHLYRQYLLDEDLQAARARWPFIHIWDDHEFSDDCWQTEANYNDSGEQSSTDEPSQRRKVAANQAWFEYMPVNLLHQEGVDADLHHAKEFTFTEVNNTENTTINEDNLADNADNIDAISTMTIYRSFRFGQWVELTLTDNRSYRSDHPIPEDVSGNSPFFPASRVALPKDLVNLLDAGKTANSGEPPLFVFTGDFILNPRQSSPPGTMLGATQKRWWQSVMARSSARWKLWGNSVPLQRFLLNTSALDIGIPDVLLTSDNWDGYRSERNELMDFLNDNDIRNVISLSGDVHAHFAGVVMDDYDTPSEPRPTVIEVVGCSVSSITQYAAIERLSRRDQYTNTEQLVRNLVTYQARITSVPEENPLVNNLNNTLLNGVLSGLEAARTNSLPDILAAKSPAVNGHLVYADTDAHGFGLFKVNDRAVTVTLFTLDNVNVDTGLEAPSVKRTVTFTIPHTEAGSNPSISEPAITGEPPFPLG